MRNGAETPADAVVTEARAAATAAAAAAGVSVRELHGPGEARAVHDLFGAIWHPAPGEEPVSAELLTAFQHSGNYVTGAFAGPELVGACVGFLAAPPGQALHSHIAGVTAAARGRHVGLALKLHQRAWALARGLAAVTWTFDPLVRRNAGFNLRRLGAGISAYLVDFYGPMHDEVNVGDATDRLLVSWDLAGPPAVRAAAGERIEPAVPPAAVVVVRTDVDGSPRAEVPEASRATGGRSTVLVPTPDDVERLRREQPDHARAWRSVIRDTLGGLLAQDAKVTGFTRDGCYVVERGRRP